MTSGCISYHDLTHGMDMNKAWEYIRDRPMIYFGESPTNYSIEILKQPAMTPFEIKVQIPITRVEIAEQHNGCARKEFGLVTVEQAKAIRDAINRQLRGLQLTEPKKKPVAKKVVAKKHSRK